MTDIQASEIRTPEAPSGNFKFPIFHGKGDEFFKIWIVNVLLTILTLGIYSAWAKVRTLKYMYGSTELESARFGFHGDPVAILKGRILASVIGFMYLAGAGISIFVSLLGILLVYFLFPFLFVKSLKFRLANTSYRNLRFSFRGTIDQAYKIWFKYTLPLLAYMIFNAFIVRYLESLKANPSSTGSMVAGFLTIAMVVGFLIYAFIALPKLYNKAINYIYNSIYYAGNKFNVNSPVADFKKFVFWPITIKYMVLVGGFILAIAILGGITAATKGASSEADVAGGMMAAMTIPLFIFYFALFCFAIYTAYLVKHYVWNRVSLDPNHHTKSKLVYIEYLKISLVNLVFTALTLGFFFPWAKMRSKKYLVENRGIQIDDFDGFTSKAEENISALSEEAVDAFDFDIEIGL